VDHSSIQSEAKPNHAIMTPTQTLLRALRQLHVISLSFDWFTALSVSFVIGQSDYFGFSFATLD